MEELKNSDYIGYADFLHIIFKDKHIEKILPDEECLDVVSFGDVLKIAKENGYREGHDVIILIAESPLHGELFKYGNYDGIGWVHFGETRGYA